MRTQNSLRMSAQSSIEALRVGLILGRQDYRKTAAGSALGRLWPTIGLAIRILFIGFIFGTVLGARPSEYISWLGTGWMVWLFISSSIKEGVTCYLSAKSFIRSSRLPLLSYPLRVVIRELLFFGQNLLFVVLLLVITGATFTSAFLMFIPGLVINALFFALFAITVAPIATRFSDLGQLTSSVVGVMFFALPIMWRPGDIGNEVAHLLLGLNPVYHLVQVVRLPLLSEMPTLTNYVLALIGIAVAGVTALLSHSRFSERVVYWL